MARPRELRLEDGTVTLQGFSTQRADELEELLTKPTESPTYKVATDEPVMQTDLQQSAVGLYKKDNSWFVVTVKYNPDTRQALVVSAEDVGTNVYKAENAFKMTVVKNNILP